MRYTFGHTETAAKRLRSIAEFFNPLAVEFIQSNLSKAVTSAADLDADPATQPICLPLQHKLSR